MVKQTLQTTLPDRPLQFLELAWADEHHLVLSDFRGLGFFEATSGMSLAAFTGTYGMHPSCPATADFVRLMNGGLWDWHWSDNIISPIAHSTFQVFDGTFDRSGNYICCGESSNLEDLGLAAVYNAEAIEVDRYALRYRAKQMALSPDQSKAAFCENNGCIEIFSVQNANKSALHFFFAGGPALSVSWSNCGNYLAVVLVKGGIELWRLSAEPMLEKTLDCPVRRDRFTTAGFVPNTDTLFLIALPAASASYLYDWRKARMIGTLSNVIHVAFSPSGERMALAFKSGEVVVQDTLEWVSAA